FSAPICLFRARALRDIFPRQWLRHAGEESPGLGSTEVRRYLFTGIHAVVAQHMGHAQAVIPEDAAPSGFLRHPVFRLGAPGFHRLLIAPEREGQDLPFLTERLEALDGKKAIDLF